jgi:hypothetical protein
MTFYISFIVFIISLLAGLALMLIGKKMGKERFHLLASAHFLLILAFVASLILRKDNSVIVNNYFFTAFICSGLMLSGLAWRIDISKVLRYYFTIFILTFPMFLFSPSMMMNFLVTSHYSSTTGKTFHIVGKYFLELQNSTETTDNIPHYKLISKTGIFHKTIQRDLVFQGEVDSVRVIEKDNQRMMIRGYTSKKTYVSEETDSTDVEIILEKNKPGAIEYHL